MHQLKEGWEKQGGGFPWTDDNSLSFYVLPNYLNWWGFINFFFGL